MTSLQNNFDEPLLDPRTPDIVLKVNTGVIFTGGSELHWGSTLLSCRRCARSRSTSCRPCSPAKRRRCRGDSEAILMPGEVPMGRSLGDFPVMVSGNSTAKSLIQ